VLKLSILIASTTW